MAFQNNFTTGNSGSKASFYLYDTAGIYPNPVTGYNAPNPTVGSVTSTTFTINLYGSTTEYIIDVKSAGVPFPNTSNIPFEILGTSMGFPADTPITSGIYFAKYKVTSAATDYTVEKYIYLNAVATCCADTLLANAVAENCVCNETNDALMQAIRMQGMILAVTQALEPSCNKVTEAVQISDLINAICAQNGGCGC